MGSAKGNRPLLANEIRLIEEQHTMVVVQGSVSLPSEASSIEKLVERLQFQNPTGAVAYLQSNPGILGQTRLLNHLEEQLVYVKEARRHGRSKEEDVTLPPRHAP